MAKARASSVMELAGRSTTLLWVAATILALLTLVIPMRAQSQTLLTLPGQWVTFDSGDGLPDDEVFTVWGAPDGTLWAGTTAGLARFDGVAWQAFNDDVQALDGAVRAVWGRSAQDVWAAGDAGLAHFDGHSWQQQAPGLPVGPLYTIWGNQQGELWIGGQEGAAYFNGEAWRAFTPQNSGLPSGPVHALAGTADGSVVWFGTEAGLARYEPQSDAWLHLAPEDTDPATLFVQALCLTEEILWVGTWDGLLRHDFTTGQWADLVDGSQWDGPDDITSIWATDRDLWLAVSAPDIMSPDYLQTLKRRSPGGLRRFDGRRWHLYGEANGLASDRVHSIWSDGQSVFWFATRNGLSRFDSERWRTYHSDSPVGQQVDVIRGDAVGQLWLAGQDALYSWQDGHWIRDLPPRWSQPRIGVLWVGGPDDVWLGSWENGAAHWNGLRWERFTSEYGLASDRVNAIWSNSPGSIWFGTSEGLSHLDRVTGEWETLTVANSDLPNDWVSALWGDTEGTLWIGTLGGGTARYEPAQRQWQKVQAGGLADSNVRSLELDQEDNLWLVTGDSVAYLNRASGSARHWLTADILPDFDEPHTLAVAPDGTAWLAGNNLGLYRYTPEQDSWQLVAPDWLNSTVERIWASPDGTLWLATMGGAIHFNPRTGSGLILTAQDGLASDDVRAIWGDKAGTLWFATNNGVSRLAGGSWQTFTGDDNWLGMNTLLLTGDESGNVWAATLTGVSRYADGGWEEILSWPNPPALWRDLYAPGQGRLWAVAPDGTLHYFDGHDWDVITAADAQSTGLLQAVVEGPQGELWVGSQQGLVQRSVDGKSWSRVELDTDAGLTGSDIHAIWGDGERYVWFATNRGISRYESATGDWRSFTTAEGLLDNEVTDLWGDDKGNVWAVQGGRVNVFDGSQWSPLPLEGLPPSSVDSVWVDEAGTLWAATRAGPARWDGSRWQLLPADPGVSGEVHALWSADDGLWIAATDSVTRYDGNQWHTYTVADGLPPGELSAIWSDGKGAAWAGGWGGLAHFDDGRWQLLAPETIPGDVYDIWGRDTNDVWIATDAGVVHFDGAQWQVVLPNEEALALVGDGQGGLWLGTRRGLQHYDGHTWHRITDQNLPQTVVWDVWRTPDGAIWVTSGQGSYRADGTEDTFRPVDDVIRALLVDGAGTLWRFDGTKLVRYISQRPLDKSLSVEVLYGDVRAIAEDAAGDIWLGTDVGLLRYRPQPPPVDIESVDLADDGRSESIVGRHIVLPYRPSRVMITLVATDTTSHGAELDFWYRLDPWDSDWQNYQYVPPADKRRRISYEGLEPGIYTFNLAVYNANKDTTQTQPWAITVSEAPFWVRVREHELFFWALGAGGLLLMAIGGVSYQALRARRAYGYRDAELIVEAVAEETYQVAWRGPRAAPPPYPTYLRHSLVDPYLKRLDADITRELELRQLGESLFNVLWDERSRQLLREGAKFGRKGWRLRLNLAAVPDLFALPWEFAYGGAGLGFVGVNPDTALVRYLPSDESAGRPKTKWPLDIVVVWAEPRDLAGLKVDEEIEAIQKALQPLETKGRLRLLTVPHATPGTFSQAVSEGADVVHFIGHGDLEAGQGVLYFEDQYGGGIPLKGSELATAFRGFQASGDKAPKLVVLNACRTAASASGSVTLGGLAPTLLQQGRVPAVVGMQYPVGAEVAASFASHFYRALVSRGGGQVDYAISVARKALSTEMGLARRDWGAPVLYMQVTDGHVFEVT